MLRQMLKLTELPYFSQLQYKLYTIDLSQHLLLCCEKPELSWSKTETKEKSSPGGRIVEDSGWWA